jgi:hypothetical protein
MRDVDDIDISGNIMSNESILWYYDRLTSWAIIVIDSSVDNDSRDSNINEGLSSAHNLDN